MAKPVVIGSRSFRTQSSALDHYKALLHRYQDGQRIVDPADHTDLRSSSALTRCSMLSGSPQKVPARLLTLSDA